MGRWQQRGTLGQKAYGHQAVPLADLHTRCFKTEELDLWEVPLRGAKGLQEQVATGSVLTGYLGLSVST